MIAAAPATDARMKPLDDQQQAARDWFEALRTRVCAEFEAIEREAGSDAAFAFTPWDRTDPDGSPGGGGVREQARRVKITRQAHAKEPCRAALPPGSDAGGDLWGGIGG